jgi:hypothetical protein
MKSRSGSLNKKEEKPKNADEEISKEERAVEQAKSR